MRLDTLLHESSMGLPYQKKQLIVAENQVAYPPIHPQMIFYSWPKSLNKTVHGIAFVCP